MAKNAKPKPNAKPAKGKRPPSRRKTEKPKGPGSKKPKAKATAKPAPVAPVAVVAEAEPIEAPAVAGRIGPSDPKASGTVLNTCATIPAAPGEPEIPTTLDWTDAEKQKVVDARETIRRRQEVVDDYQGKLKEARASLENAHEDFFALFDRVAHATPIVDPKTGQRNLFASPAAAPGTAGGAAASAGKAPNAALDDDDIREAIQAASDASVFKADLAIRQNLPERTWAILTTAGVKSSGDLLALAARRGVYWWRDLGLDEKEARQLTGLALRHLESDPEVCADALIGVVGDKYADPIRGDADGELANEVNDLGLLDARVLEELPEHSRKVYEPAAALIQECRVVDIGTLAVWLRHAERFWWTAFPGLGAVAIEVLQETVAHAARAILDRLIGAPAEHAPEEPADDGAAVDPDAFDDPDDQD